MIPRALFTFLIFISPLPAFACSFAIMTEEFEIVPGEGAPPAIPYFETKDIVRGTDDGNYASCSDAGILTLKLLDTQSQPVGYMFRIVQGQFEDKLFYEQPIQATDPYREENLYKFVWLDGSSDVQEPIDITLEIVAISKTGHKSGPQTLRITHPGVSKPWWKFW
ncbi:hypothetical protein [Corallincola spongiicola]|uniref:Uncharacterized protein n=1 Tax=Corallincola spongiicola TaxID=2520508 RepID=A0ABY1WUW5_9GAMM|nr:hypothetical protein [Corallincola spongiicola]TAA48549.1 hypothetical protein EXY25_04830 [Corallincola spongiicola]